MRADRTLPLMLLCLAVLAPGCARRAADAPPPSVAAARAHEPAPADPDLAAVMERFYQQVEGGHWRFAYAMLSARYRAGITEAGLRSRYDELADLDVNLRQTTDRVVVARLDAHDRLDRARVRTVAETTTLAWDGGQWVIEAIRRRDVPLARPR